ncbi:hypothetical protein FRC08_005559, partial [Ceratobasidium sp. 394]
EIVTGKIPFDDKPDMAVYVSVFMQRQTPERPVVFPSFERAQENILWEVMVNAWAYSPLDRPDSVAIEDRVSRRVSCLAKRSNISYVNAKPS